MSTLAVRTDVRVHLGLWAWFRQAICFFLAVASKVKIIIDICDVLNGDVDVAFSR